MQSDLAGIDILCSSDAQKNKTTMYMMYTCYVYRVDCTFALHHSDL